MRAPKLRCWHLMCLVDEGMIDASPLPEDAFLCDSTEVLIEWLDGNMSETPDWIADAVATLQPLERKAVLGGDVTAAWPMESARCRLRISALENDGLEMTAALQEELFWLDKALRATAKTETNEDACIQIGAIRKALRRHLSERIERRQKVAYGTARVAI